MTETDAADPCVELTPTSRLDAMRLPLAVALDRCDVFVCPTNALCVL